MSSESITTALPAAGREDRRLDPAILFRPGDFDAWAVLGVWYVRRLALPVFWVGLMIAILADPQHVANISLDSAEDTWRALLSPLAGIVIAIALRMGANFAALLLALPASAAIAEGPGSSAGRGRKVGSWGDRLNVASALRSLRWTLDARRFAVGRLGPRGRLFAILDRAFVVANVSLPVLALAVSVIVSD